jgi:hypothetical protein
MNCKSALWLLAGLLVAGCGKDAPTCETFPCANGANSYRFCSSESSQLSYVFGGQTCACNGTADSAACQACSAAATSYCGGDGGAGNTSASCMTTFSGGFMGSFTPCGVTLTQTTPTTWVISGSGGAVAMTTDVWEGFTMTNAGVVAVGTFDETDSMLTVAGATRPSAVSTEGWNAGFGQGATSGAFEVAVSALGDGVTNSDGSISYPDAHGSIAATLVDPHGAEIAVTVAISF